MKPFSNSAALCLPRLSIATTAVPWLLQSLLYVALCSGCSDAPPGALQAMGSTPPVTETTPSPRIDEAGEADLRQVPAESWPDAEPKAGEGSGVPRAVIEETFHEFGTLSLHEVGAHSFAIRNDGSAPLELAPIASSCKCITLEIERAAIPPGESGDVVVYWKSGEVQEQFAQAISLKTNDAELPVVQFKVLGSYLPVVAAQPPELFLPRVAPDEPATAHTHIVSQRWENFTLEDFESSLAGAHWEIQPAGSAELDRLNAKAGYRVTVTLPSELPEGPFTHWIRFTAVAAGADGDTTTERLEMPLVGKVLRRVAVYGKGVDTHGALHLGTVTSGTEHRQQFLVKVHDREPALSVTSVDATPDFLEVSLEPYGDGSKEDLYSLTISVPANAQQRVYRGKDAGRIAISFDHPRVSPLELAVDLVVSPAGRFTNR